MSNLQIVKSQIDLAKTDFETNISSMDVDLNFQKEASFALQMFESNTYLQKMSPESIRNAIVNVSLTGITLNPAMKMAYLVPRKGKCVLDISYVGLIKILTDTGSVKNIESRIVYSNEPFEIEQGSSPYVKHGIAPTKDKGHIIGVYSAATLNDGSKSVEWMYKEDIDSIMQRSEAVKADKMSPWKTDYDQMARKTVVKRHYKFLPKSERGLLAANAIDIDHENNGIDFKAEAKKAERKSMSIDTVPSGDESIKEQLSALREKMTDGTVPDKFKSGETVVDVIQILEGMEEEFASGSLIKEKFDKWNKYLLKCYEAFNKNGD